MCRVALLKSRAPTAAAEDEQTETGWDKDTAAGLSGAVDSIRSHVLSLRCLETN